MPLAANALISLAEIKDVLNLTDTTKDALLTRYINAASTLIETYCQRSFQPQTFTHEQYDGTGTQELVLRNYPVTNLATIERNLAVFGTSDWDTLQMELVTLKNDANSGPGIVFYWGGFLKGNRNYRVTYTAGYTVVPEDLREAAIEYIAYQYKRRNSLGLQSERLGEYSYVNENLLQQRGPVTRNIFQAIGIDMVLDAYRTPTI